MRQKKVANAHKVVKAMRLYLGMTQSEAAKAVGLDERYSAEAQFAERLLIRLPSCL